MKLSSLNLNPPASAERRERDLPPPDRKRVDDDGPAPRSVPKPGEDNELLRRLRKVNPDQARKYRQRSGE
ncbi:MAG: ubiquitin-like protein UBact [Armatimonadota bacterium]